MIEKLKFSVGIPAYKGRFLSECIASILNQSYPLFELIIINDCSPDPIDSIVAQFDDNRIKYFKNSKNEGAEYVANNYNRCVEKANGDFFVLMGDDDKMEPDYLEEFAKLIQQYPELDVFHCRSLIIDEHSDAVIYTPSWPEYETVYDNIWHHMNGCRSTFIADYVYRLSALKENGGYYYMPIGWFTDNITSYIAMSDKGIAHTNQPVFNYRMHSMTISSIGSYELKMKATIRQHAWFINFLKNEPTSPQDLIVYKELCKNINRQLQRHKFDIIASSFDVNLVSNYIKWLSKRKEYEISFNEIAYSLFHFLKIKRGARKQILHKKNYPESAVSTLRTA